ncbi:hypothetical protein NBO_55g0003 [Nosema bombycis CQ1]|uniref:Uncharacterized protein n=1 Tax=Nosema bombycis (strain CQ1 / CVCC 102059) TaxID=578461 RepID=R0MLX4_NOSB1|nr:hypothetical protein NBO_55g0003 [Nosema bombycis CQ1]|eukprot:EOB13838.1 hypothetical protein NBO_55g0003 [Nosema bombycis CQ1]
MTTEEILMTAEEITMLKGETVDTMKEENTIIGEIIMIAEEMTTELVMITEENTLTKEMTTELVMTTD